MLCSGHVKTNPFTLSTIRARGYSIVTSVERKHRLTIKADRLIIGVNLHVFLANDKQTQNFF